MKSVTKIYKTYNLLIRLVIILATYGYIYQQIFYKRKLEDVLLSFTDYFHDTYFQLCLLSIILLMVLNWGVESFKWKLLIGKVEKVSFLKSIKAVMAGVSVSMFTPNRTGDYLGRVFILEKANRLEGVLITIIGSISQVVITLVVGAFAFLAVFYNYGQHKSVITEYLNVTLILLVPIVVFCVLVFYYNVSVLTPFLKKYLKKKWAKYEAHVNVFSRYSSRELSWILFLSLIRYFIFSFQFYLLLNMFSVRLPYLEGILLIAVIYLAMAVIPTIALADLGIRGSVSIYFIGLYFARHGLSTETLNQGIFAASSLVWLINLVIPAVLGTFFVYNLKFFRSSR